MENTAKNFVLQLGSLISLYVSLGALISVLFGVITIMFPDQVAGSWEYEGAQSTIRFGIALLVIFFPVYLVLTRKVNSIRRKEHGVYLALTKWLIYLSLLLGTLILLGDLVAVIYEFLNGEITTRFLLKALVLLVGIGSALAYYSFDARNYWNTHEKESKLCALGALILVVATLVVGYMQIDSPKEVREVRFDQEQISDLTDIQYMIESYYLVEKTLPSDIEMLYTEKGVSFPTAPEGRSAYTYRVTSPSSFELCAEFARASEEGDHSSAYIGEKGGIQNPYDWKHGTGEVCFDRVIALPSVGQV